MKARASILSRVAALADPNARRQEAKVLARELGAADLIVFIPDPDVGLLLPAPGFPQTLPGGRRWQAFLGVCATSGRNTGQLPFPNAGTLCEATGLAQGGAVLVLLGGSPRLDDAGEVALLLPLLMAAFQGERTARSAAGYAALARASAAEAEDLMRALDRVRQELQLALTETKRALRVRDEFLASVSHDLRTPLTTIQGSAQMLERLLARGGEPEVGRLQLGLLRVRTASAKMLLMINQLLDLARLGAGETLVLNRQPTDLVALVTRAVELHRQLNGRHTIVVEACIPALVGTWDAVRLERVVDNLLSNAVKYSPDGGSVHITLDIARQDEQRWAILTVKDEGIGIPAEDLPHIFDRFYRGTNATGFGGAGIGLAGTRDLIEQHGGAVEVRSVEQEGTTVTVRLPLTEPTVLE